MARATTLCPSALPPRPAPAPSSQDDEWEDTKRCGCTGCGPLSTAVAHFDGNLSSYCFYIYILTFLERYDVFGGLSLPGTTLNLERMFEKKGAILVLWETPLKTPIGSGQGTVFGRPGRAVVLARRASDLPGTTLTWNVYKKTVVFLVAVF